MDDIKRTINIELGVLEELDKLVVLQRKLNGLMSHRQTKFFELYKLYLGTNNKEEAYRKATEDVDYYFEQILGKKQYDEIKRIEKFISERMDLLKELL